MPYYYHEQVERILAPSGGLDVVPSIGLHAMIHVVHGKAYVGMAMTEKRTPGAVSARRKRRFI